jgi:N-acetylglucosamine-6-phosphate deacetylase
MDPKTCSGVDVETGNPIEISFDEAVLSVRRAGGIADGTYIAPGFIDIQVNGFAAVDYNNPATPHEDIARSLQFLFATGVTRFYPTVITGAPADMVAALGNLSRARDTLPDGDSMDGFHVEGPHICAEEGPRGAHPRQWVRPPDLDEFRRWQDATGGRVRIVTLSPEWPEAPRYIEKITSEGVVAAIGHMQATTGQIDDAVAAGATLSTHLGNGAHGLLRRHPNYIWDQLADDRLMADFIVDGIHLDAAFLKVAMRAKTIDRAVLITDAAAPAGSNPGRYRLGEQDVEHTADGRVVLAGTERLAGSALRMDRGVDNLMRLATLSLREAVCTATTNAARAGAVPRRQRGLVPGDRADFVQFRRNPTVEVIATYISGRRVFAA